MYKKRIINRTGDNNNISDSAERMNKANQHYDFDELEDFVMGNKSCKKFFDCIKNHKNNDWYQRNNYCREGLSGKNTFIFIENVDFSAPHSAPIKGKELEIKVDNERNIFINGKKMDAEILEDGTKFLTIGNDDETNNETDVSDETEPNNDENGKKPDADESAEKETDVADETEPNNYENGKKPDADESTEYSS